MGHSRYDLAAEARRLRAMGEGLSIPAIARELNLDAYTVGEMLMWLPCEECFRPTPRRARVHRSGLRRCPPCDGRARRETQSPVSVGPFLDAMRQCQMTPVDVARQLGWQQWGGNSSRHLVADGSRVRRVLGLRPGSDGRVRRQVSHAMAVRLARAIDPTLIAELGL